VFRKQTVYPRLLTKPAVDIAKMKAVQWLDAQTGSVAMAIVAYTEGLEMFTLVTVKFNIDEAGNIEPVVEFTTWKDLQSSEEGTYRLMAAIVAFAAFIGVLHSIYILYGEPELTAALAWSSPHVWVCSFCRSG